jgi:hypothetical protein
LHSDCQNSRHGRLLDLLGNQEGRQAIYKLTAYSCEIRHQFQFKPATDSKQNPPHETTASSLAVECLMAAKERPVELADLDGSRSASTDIRVPANLGRQCVGYLPLDRESR